MRPRQFLTLAIVALVNSVRAFGASVTSDIDEIALERIGRTCDGPCPEYKLTVWSNGTIQYEGKEFVTVQGLERSTISRSDFERLASKVAEIHFFDLNDNYHCLAIGGSTSFVTDQPTQIVTVKARNRTKRVEDYLGAPKGLRELEELIDEITHSSQWTGRWSEDADVPYYDAFPLNRKLTFRGLLEHYSTGDAPNKIVGYVLMFLKNNGVSFTLEPREQVDPSHFDGYVVDVTGHIEDRPKVGFVFVTTEIRSVRRYLDTPAKSEELNAQSKR